MSNPPKDPLDEDFSEDEDLVFEEDALERVGTPRTVPASADFFVGQILGGRFEVVDAPEGPPDAEIRSLRARDRVRGGSDLLLEVVRREVLERLTDLPARIQAAVPRLKDLSHESINPLLDFGMLPDGRLYFASQHLHGRRLSEQLERNEPLPAEDAFLVTQRVLRALEYGHTLRQVHGDLSPEQVLLEEGNDQLVSSVRLLSFGHRAVLAPVGEAPTRVQDLRASGQLLAALLVGRPLEGEPIQWWDANAPNLSRQENELVRQGLLSARLGGFSEVVEFRSAIESLPRFQETEAGGGWVRTLALAGAAGALAAAGLWWFQKDDAEEGGLGNTVSAAERDEARDLEAEAAAAAAVAGLEAPSADGAPPEAPPSEEFLALRLDEQLARLRDGLDATNRTVIDLRAATQGLTSRFGSIDERLSLLDERVASFDARMGAVDERIEALERAAAAPQSVAVAPPAAPALPLPDEAAPELRAAAEELFGGSASPFGPLGSRSIHHTRTADGEEGWMIVTVEPDEAPPAGADRSWLLDEEYLSAQGESLGARTVRVVQRGARFEEVDGRVYGLLDLESPWIELSSEIFEPLEVPTPPARLGLSQDALAAFRERLRTAQTVALVEVDAGRSSWFVPGLGFVRYVDPERIRRELVLVERR